MARADWPAERYGFRLEPEGDVMDCVFGLLPFEDLEAAKHTGSKWVWGYIQYVRTSDGGATWEVVETDDHRDRV